MAAPRGDGAGEPRSDPGGAGVAVEAAALLFSGNITDGPGPVAGGHWVDSDYDVGDRTLSRADVALLEILGC